MGWFDGKSREEEKMEEAHREGQKDGSEDAGFWKEWNTDLAYRLFEGDKVADAYKAGVENGENNRPQSK